MANDLRLLTPGTVRLGTRDATTPQGWFTSGGGRPGRDARERLGYSQAAQTSSLYSSPSSHYSFYKQHRELFPAQYWSLYKTSPDVRSCVDSITRRIATWDWVVKPTTDPRDAEEYTRLSQEAERVAKFLRVPNSNGETWQEVLTRTITDLLVYDAGVMEMVEDAQGEFQELVSWLGSEWFPVIDTHGHLLHYDQSPENSTESPVEVPRDRVVHFTLFPNNRATLGLPLLESCITECLTVLLSSEHAMTALDADEIPPGLLVLGGVAGAAAERARADLQSMKGKDHRIRVITSPEPSGIEARWVELRHTMKDLELLQVVDTMRRAIWRVFGVQPVELGDTNGVPRASAEVQVDVSSSHLITPILEIIQAKVNAQILPRLLEPGDADRVVFTFQRGQTNTPDQNLKVAQSSEILLKRGVLTVNEVRQQLGLLPLEGGDVPTVETSLGPVPLTALAEGQSPGMTLPSSAYGDADDQYPGAYRGKLDDLSQEVQENLRERAREHNGKVRAAYRRTTPEVLAQVFARGVGAYHSNPESVRPNVSSPEQWGYGRVDSFLYALREDEFRRGPHDTDLMNPDHPLSTAGEKSRRSMEAREVAGRVPDLPLAPVDTAWGWSDREAENVLGDPPDWDAYRRIHLWRDPDRPRDRRGYKFPIARMVDGRLQVVFRGVASVVGALREDGKHESLDGVSLADQGAVYRHVRRLYERFGMDPPVVDRLEDTRDRYDGINFTPPQDAQEELRRGLQWYEDGHGGDGLVPDTIRWARRLARGEDITPAKARKMRAWLARHEVDKEAEGFRPGEDGFPSPGRVAWALWAGDPGVRWSNALVARLDRADQEAEDRHVCGPGCEHPHHHHDDRNTLAREWVGMHPQAMALEIHTRAVRTWLPSDWQSTGKFQDVRTVDLGTLAGLVAGYTRSVARVYEEAALECSGIVSSAYGVDGLITVPDSQAANRRIGDALDALAAKWSAVGLEFYLGAAELGVEAAREFLDGREPEVDARAMAEVLYRESMEYLTGSRGLVGTLRDQLRRVVSNTTLARSLDTEIDELTPDTPSSLTVSMTASTFAVNSHRVGLVTGQLVGLTNEVLAEALTSVVLTTQDQEGITRPVVWMVEWVSAGGRSCPICAAQGVAGFQRLDQLAAYPGADTYCGGNCRCVLVLWTREEVESGRAVSLSTPAGEVSENPLEVSYLPPGRG